MPTDPSPGTFPPRADTDPGDTADGAEARPPRAGVRAESPTRRAHRIRIKSLLKSARTAPQTV